jgi:hemoglobin
MKSSWLQLKRDYQFKCGTMKKDIENKKDIQKLVNSFYEKVKQDAMIGFIFTDIVRVNWERHLPVMYDFWENTLFYTGNYIGNPMEIHRHLHKIVPLTVEYFTQWTYLFTSTVDELFAGEKASLAKQRAISIAAVMQFKILPSVQQTIN